jgi:hypothetical protein
MAADHAAMSPSTTDADLNQQVDALNDQAQRCRRLAGVTYNREISQMLDNLAHDFERSAGELESRRDA